MNHKKRKNELGSSSDFGTNPEPRRMLWGEGKEMICNIFPRKRTRVPLPPSFCRRCRAGPGLEWFFHSRDALNPLSLC